MKKNKKNTIFIIIFIAVILLIFLYNHKKIYYAENFGIKTVTSEVDYDNDGIDDYTDILEGAKIEAKNRPKYKSAYYIGGYPPDNEGVCTDVIWRALKNAGYSLKDMVDTDIKNNVEKYPIGGKIDPNIDFRRVKNLKIYFERNQLILTTDLANIEEWQPGDIAVFGESHIGIISDKRNAKGIPYLLHNSGKFSREGDVLEKYDKTIKITGHYRMNSYKL